MPARSLAGSIASVSSPPERRRACTLMGVRSHAFLVRVMRQVKTRPAGVALAQVPSGRVPTKPVSRMPPDVLGTAVMISMRPNSIACSREMDARTAAAVDGPPVSDATAAPLAGAPVGAAGHGGSRNGRRRPRGRPLDAPQARSRGPASPERASARPGAHSCVATGRRCFLVSGHRAVCGGGSGIPVNRPRNGPPHPSVNAVWPSPRWSVRRLSCRPLTAYRSRVRRCER
jgi:hypothetical protein